MDLLFRPVFRGTKTPIVGSGSFPDRQYSLSTDDNNEPEEGMNTRARPTSRVSSYIGFRAATPPTPAPETFPNFRNPDSVYHRPSGDQLTEMLKVVMMNQSNMDPIPIQYNSTILHVLEAYQDLRMQLIAKEESVEVLKQSHTKDIKDFEELAAAWQQKEGEYKAEMRKLEVLLAKTEGGMEAVSMARSRSVIHGAVRAADTISRGIGTIKARNAARYSHDSGVDSPDFGPVNKSVRSRRPFQVRDDRESSATASFESARQLPKKRATISSHACAERSQHSEGSSQLYDSPEVHSATTSSHDSYHTPQTLTKAQLEALEQQQALEFGIQFESSTSGADSSSISHRSEFPVTRGPHGLGLGILEKPLPEIPINAKERAKQTTLDRFLHGRKHSYSDPNTAANSYGERAVSRQMGFSFQPGDDEDLLGQRTERDRAARKTVDEHLEHRSSPSRLSEPRSETASSTRTQKPPQRPRGTARPGLKPRPSVSGLSAIAKPSLLPQVQDHDQLTRMDSSSSSVVTAVRDNSGRSSANNSQIGRPKLNRNAGGTGSGSGSSEAVSTAAATAAARAYAASSMRSPTVSRKGSAAGSGGYLERNDEERRPSLMSLSGRMMSSTSTTASSVAGSQAGNGNGNGKKVAGGMRGGDFS